MPKPIRFCHTLKGVVSTFSLVNKRKAKPIEVSIVALPETAGSALYGMVDVLSSAGNLWSAMTGLDEERQVFRARILSIDRTPFRCRHGIPVEPDLSLEDDPRCDIVIVPEIWLRPEASIKGRYETLMAWLRASHKRGAAIYSACSGSILLAESGLLDRKEATSHWEYEDLFRKQYPLVRFKPEPSLCFADATGRIVTAGGVTSWHDLAIHIISRHSDPGEALRIAKLFLLKRHEEGQRPYTRLVRPQLHGDSVVRACETWLEKHFRTPNIVASAVAASSISERSLKRRFHAALGRSLLQHVQLLRIEEAKRRLETSDTPIDDISVEVGYEEIAFFRRLFKRYTGLTPHAYRRMFSWKR